MESVTFRNTEFEIKHLNLDNFGEVTIAQTALSELLILNGRSYRSEEARLLDEQIFYYVEPDEFNLSDKELAALIMNQIQ
jgi:hypothetical protein